MNNLFSLLLCLLTLSVSLNAAHAIVAPPTYTQTVSVIDSGGGVSTSPGYENLGAIGQPIIGLSPGPVGSNHAGFIPVLGANGILWPVIGFDPASFTFSFTINGPAPSGQGLNLTNTGGSTLAWQAAAGQSWLTLNPANGTGTGTVTVGIATTGLLPGNYQTTITLTGTGAENSGITIPVSLTVAQDYTLTVKFVFPTTPPGVGVVMFVPPPTIGNSPCTGNPCQGNYTPGTTVDLAATTDVNSTMSWTGPCEMGTGGTSGSCKVYMTSSKEVTATFSFVKPAMIEGTTQYYDTLQLAYNAALTGQTIRAREFTFVDDLTLSEAKGVTIKGGFDTKYSTQNGYSLLKGKLTVVKGSLVTERLTVK
jgi:hypothetical protein